MKLEKSIFIFDGHNGTYIPQLFAEEMIHPSCLYEFNTERGDALLTEMLNDLIQGRDNEYYWDNWNTIISHYNEMRKIGTNELFYLTQGEDGDLWLVHEDELEEWNEYESGEQKDYNQFVLVVSEVEEQLGNYYCYIEDWKGDVVWECDDEGVADFKSDGTLVNLPHEDLDLLLTYLRSIDRLGAESKLRLSNSIL